MRAEGRYKRLVSPGETISFPTFPRFPISLIQGVFGLKVSIYNSKNKGCDSMCQKRIAIVNDMTGFGRCSTAVQLPIISALKIQGCLFPTAILSVHTGFPDFFIDDYTDRMQPYMESWRKNHLAFDGILTGFLGSVSQVEIVMDFIRDFKKGGTKVIMDPVMGDNGKLYPSYTEELCRRMRELLALSDVITPNLTEACELLDLPYPEEGTFSREILGNMACALSEKGPSGVVITGLPEGEDLMNFMYERGKGFSIHPVKKIGSDRSGTGDVYSAVVAAKIVRGESLENAVKSAASFVSRCMTYTEELDLPRNWGLAFEEFLTDLK